MFLQRLGVIRAAAGAMIALALTLTPAYAGGGGGGHGGGGGGGGHGGGGGGGYHGGGGYYGGYRGGYYGGYRGGYGYGYYGPSIGIYIGGYSDYPSYGYTASADYYNPDVPYAQPYVEPSAGPTLAVNADQPAHITVQLPNADAHVWFDGNATRQGGVERTFATPPLTSGRTYHYQIQVKWIENGTEMSKTAHHHGEAG